MFNDLDDFDNAPVAKPKAREQFPCGSCQGTGYYRGVRVHQQKSHCFSCKGKGYFLTSPAQRQKNREAARTRKAKKAQEKQAAVLAQFAAWRAANQELADYLAAVSSWNNFAQEMLAAAEKWGSLTPNQLAACERMHAKHQVREAEKVAREAAKPTIDLTRIHALFATAQASGLKKPVLRIGALKLSLAPESGRNAGCVYVKDNDEYAGKLTPAGKWYGLREARPEIEAELIALAEDPFAQAVAYGRRTGRCCCCGATLTNATSVELGIGPICRANWGL